MLAQVFALALAGLASPGDSLDFDAMATRFLARHGIDSSADAGRALEPLLEKAFERVDLGGFEVLVPRLSLSDEAHARILTRAVRALFVAQEAWLAHVELDAAERKALGEESEKLEAWLVAWKPKDLARAASDAERDLCAALARKPVVVEAAARLERQGRGPGFFSTDAEHPPARIVLFPRRADFVEFACLLGVLEPETKEYFWKEDLHQWTELVLRGTRFIPLEFPLADSASDYTRGVAMDAKNPRGLEEQVAQLGLRSLFDAAFGTRIDPVLAAGLANLLVVDGFGEVDTRSDGDMRGKQTSARSIFVPGQNVHDGFLPPDSAESRWRAEKGRDYFVPLLRAAQKKGAKEARSKAEELSTFLLVSDDGAKERAVSGPFLGAGAELANTPREFRGDVAEFQRAYRAGFLHWLRSAASGKEAASREAFGRFLTALGTHAGEDALAAALEASYGMPLSGETCDEANLEGRFLAWLAKQRS